MPSAEELYAQNLTLKAELANLEAQVAWFQRQMFGARSEKQPLDVPAQIKLGLAETPQQERIRQTVTYERRTPTSQLPSLGPGPTASAPAWSRLTSPCARHLVGFGERDCSSTTPPMPRPQRAPNPLGVSSM